MRIKIRRQLIAYFFTMVVLVVIFFLILITLLTGIKRNAHMGEDLVQFQISFYQRLPEMDVSENSVELISSMEELQPVLNATEELFAPSSESILAQKEREELILTVEEGLQRIKEKGDVNFDKFVTAIKVEFLFFSFLVLIFILLIFLNLRDQMKEYAYKNLTEIYERKMIYQLEQERNILAYNMHDDIAQSLVFIKTFLESTNEEFLIRKKVKAQELASEVLEKIREISHALRAPSQNEGDFDGLMKVLCEDLNGKTSMVIHYNFLGTSQLQLGDEVFLHLYRIVQELLNNGIKHSGGDRADIRFLCSHPQLIIQYSDDGKGFDDTIKGKNSLLGTLGLNGIRYRCQLLNANVHFHNNPGGGAMVRLEVPLEELDEADTDY